MKGYLNLQQTCEALGVKRSTLYKLINQGTFNGKGETIVHCNKRWFSVVAVDNYIQKVIEANISNNYQSHHIP